MVQELLTIITSIQNHYLFINPFIINQIDYHQIIIHLYFHIILQTIIIIITHYDLNYHIILDFYEHYLIYYQEN